MAHVAAQSAWSQPASPLPSIPWALLGRAAAGVAQTLGLAAVMWLLVALPGLLTDRDSTAVPGKRPAAAMVARR